MKSIESLFSFTKGTSLCWNQEEVISPNRLSQHFYGNHTRACWKATCLPFERICQSNISNIRHSIWDHIHLTFLFGMWDVLGRSVKFSYKVCGCNTVGEQWYRHRISPATAESHELSWIRWSVGREKAIGGNPKGLFFLFYQTKLHVQTSVLINEQRSEMLNFYYMPSVTHIHSDRKPHTLTLT